jgi:DNA-binding response OmpR family regulator
LYQTVALENNGMIYIGDRHSMEETKKPVILIVEDDPVLSKMYSEKFIFEGFTVVTAKDGQEALDKASSQSISVILLDIMLPRMSGTDFLESYRKLPKGKNTPVIALTNLDEEEERARAKTLGVKEYLTKSGQTPENVVRKIKSYI